MADESMPAQPKTTQLPAADKNEILLAEIKTLMTQGLSALDAKVAIGFGRLSADIALVSTDLGVVKDRVNVLEAFKVDSESRMSRTSTAVRGASQVDMEQAAQLAQERTAREDLAKQVASLATTNAAQLAILSRLDRLAANPAVKVLLFALGTVATGYLASKGLPK